MFRNRQTSQDSQSPTKGLKSPVKSPITLMFDGSVYSTEDVVLHPLLAEFFDQPKYTMRARVAFALELILLGITESSPKHKISESSFAVRLVLGLQSKEFMDELCKELRKHFTFYSSNFSTSVSVTDDSTQLKLSFPSKVINFKWADVLVTKGVATNPEHYNHIDQMIRAILQIAAQKINDPADNLETKIRAMELMHSMLHVALKVQSWDPDGLRTTVKASVAGLVDHCEASVTSEHKTFITQLSTAISSYCKFDNLEVSKVESLKSMLAEAIAKRIDLLEVLRFKTQELHSGGGITDYRLPIVVSSVTSDLATDLLGIQHGVLALTGATEEAASNLPMQQLAWCAVEASYWDAASQTKLFFILNLQRSKLDLHGFNANNARVLLGKFLQHHLFSFNIEPLTIDVGKGSHSPNSISRLAPVIARMLKYFAHTVPGLIHDFSEYSQVTGHIVVQPRDLIEVPISAELTDTLAERFNDELSVKLRNAFYDEVKDFLDRRKLACNSIARVKISFAGKTTYELQQYLKREVLFQKLTGYFNLRNGLVVWDRTRTTGIDFIMVPKALIDFIPGADQFLTVTLTKGSPRLTASSFA